MDSSTITSKTLAQQPKLAIPTQTQDTTPYQNIIDGALTGLPDVQGKVDSAQRTSDALLANLAKNSGETINKEQYSQDQQNLAGVTDRQKELDALNAQFTDLGAQIKGLSRASQAVPLQVQENAVGNGVTTRVAQGQTEAELRKNAIKALSLASESDILGAQVTNSTSRLERAKENAQKAVDLKYKPIEAEIARVKDLLELNKTYILDPAEKKLLEKQTVALNERARLIQEKVEEEKTNNDLIINAQSQLAPPEVIARAKAVIDNGGKTKDVVMSLGKYAGEYQQALHLQEQIKTSKLNQSLIGENILQTRLENAKKTIENATLINSSNPEVKKEAVLETLTSTVNLIDGIKTSGGMSGAVGVYGVSRWTPFTVDKAEQKDFIASVSQLADQKTIETLLSLKQAGGTLGALSEGEREMLKNASTKINNWAIREDGKPDGKVIGYEIDEKSFSDELGKLRKATNSAIVRSGGVEIPDASVPNKFQQSLGMQNVGVVAGAGIINKANDDGTFDYKLPTKTK